MQKINLPLKAGLVLLVLATIVGSAFWVRRDAFWLSHWKGDQAHYATLAMKLERFGLNGYNLRESRIRFVEPSKDVVLVYAEPGFPGEEGDLITILKIVGQSYYDEPLHMRTPLFAWVVMWAHKLFAQKDQPYILCSSNLGKKVKTEKPEIVYRAQIWAVGPALFLNLAVIVAVFVLGWRLFNARVGLYSAALMAGNPVHVFLGYKLLADDLLVLLMIASFLLFQTAYKNKNLLGVAAAGALAGLAFLTKQTAAFIFAAVWVYTLLDHPDKRWSAVSLVKKMLNIPALVFGSAMFAVTAFWFVKVWQVYGNVLHQPNWNLMLQSIQDDTSGWAIALYRRPHPIFLFSLGILSLSPLMAFAYPTLPELRRQTNTIVRENLPNSNILFLWAWILAFYIHFAAPWNLLNFNGNREHRYFYLAYPAIFVLASYTLDKIRNFVEKRAKNALIADVLIVVALIANGWWGVSKVMKLIFNNDLLL